MANFAAYVFEQLAKSPEKVMLYWPEVHGHRVYTAAELLQLAAAYKTGLAEVRAKTFIPLSGLSAEMLMLMLLVMAEGGSLLVPPAKGGLAVLRKLQGDANFGGFISCGKGNRWKRLLLRALGFTCLHMKAHPFPSPLTFEALPQPCTALISYSSGSTGQPKPIHRTHSALLAQHQCLKTVFPPFEEQVDCSVFANVLLHQLAAGVGSLVPQIKKGKLPSLRPPILAQQWQQAGVNTFTANPFTYKRLCAQYHPAYARLRACGIGGAPVAETLLAQMRKSFPNAELYVLYGATEAEPIAVRKYEEAYPPHWGYAVGKPVMGDADFKLIDTLQLCIDGEYFEAGEICVKGPHVILSDAEWHATGDMGYLRGQTLFLTARRGNTQVYAGYQHYQLEHVLGMLPGIDQVAAIMQSNGVRLYYSGSLLPGELAAQCSQHFPEIKPLDILRQKIMPLDKRHHSKILYHKLAYGNRIPTP